MRCLTPTATTLSLLLGTSAMVLSNPAQAWHYKVLHTFCEQANCPDGFFPQSGLIEDANGNLFGTTFGGGNSSSGGVIFELVWNASTGKYKYKKLWDFCSLADCADGHFPQAALVLDTAGNLYGTASGGGVIPNSGGGFVEGAGTVFKLTPSGQFTVLYTFCFGDGCGNIQQYQPEGQLTYAGQSSGQLYDA